MKDRHKAVVADITALGFGDWDNLHITEIRHTDLHMATADVWRDGEHHRYTASVGALGVISRDVDPFVDPFAGIA